MHQVIIIGGGLIGSLLALALHQNDLDAVTLIDAADPFKELDTQEDGRSLALSYQTYCFLESLGVLEALGSLEPLWHIQITHDQTSEPLCFHAHEVGDHPMGFMVKAQKLKRVLYNALRETPVRWLTSTQPQALEDIPYGWRVLSDQGVCAEGALLVGADGRHSWTRQWMGVQTRRHDYDQTALVFNVTHEKPHEGWAFEHFLPSGPFAVLPGSCMGEEHTSSVVWSMKTPYAPTFLEMGQDAFDDEMNQRFQDLGRMSLCSARWSYPLQLIWPHTMMGKRWVLIGDAAHALHPIAGQGFNLGVQDLQVFLEKVLEHHRLGLDCGSSVVLQEYRKARYPRGLAMALATHGVNALFSQSSYGLYLVRQAGLSLFRRGAFLKQGMIRYAMGRR